MTLSIEKKVALAFTVALVVVGGMGTLSYLSTARLREVTGQVVRSHEVIVRSESLFSTLTVALTGIRGFVVNGDESFLLPYTQAIQTIDSDMQRLSEATVENPSQRELLGAIAAEVEKLLALSREIIEIRQGRKTGALQPLGNEAKQHYDGLRGLIDKMKHNEEALLKGRERLAQQSAMATQTIILIGSVFGIGMVTLALIAINRGLTARYRAGEALDESEERFGTLANNISQFAWMADEKGYIFWYNKRWFDYTGTTLEEMQGWGWQNVHHPDHVQRVVEKITHCFESGEIWEDTFPLRGVGGNYRWFLSRAVPIRDEQGRVLRWFGTNTDITEQREGQEALRQSAKLGEIVQMHDLASVTVCDLDNRITRWNSGCQRLYGFSAQEAVGKLNQELLRTRFPEPVENIFKTLLETGRWMGELGHTTSDGRDIAIASEWALWRDAAGQPAAVLKVNTDVTEVRRTTVLLQGERARLAALIDSAMDGVVTIDETQKITLFNPSAERMFGIKADKVKGQSLEGLIPQRFRPTHAGHVNTFGNTGVSGRQMGALGSIMGLRTDGSEFPIEASISQVEVDGQKYFTAILRDITDRVRADANIRALNAELEDRVIERTRQLENKNKELETFTYSVSHDLKAPLRGIDGYSRLLLEDYGPKLDEEGRAFLSNVRRGTLQMGQLIDDLLSYSRLERREFHKESLDVAKLVSRLLAERDDEIEKRGANVIVDVPPANVSADAQGLTMAFRNLVDNAVKFTKDVPSPEIRITGDMNPKSYVLSVRDNGVGFDMKFYDRIFEIFQRLHRAEDFSGTGVGLAIVRKAMERMGGRVWAESEVGKGATFHLEIPR